MFRSRRALLIAIVAAALTVLPPAWHGASAATTIGPKAYYLALGDSLAYGFQPDLQVFKGYADDFTQNIQAITTTTLVNMGCPSESSTTLIQGGCPALAIVKYRPGGKPYGGAPSQLAAALTFLQQHPGQVSPVTIDIGANDFLPLVESTNCMTPTQTFTQTLATFDRNFSTTLYLLHRQLGGTGDLLAMTYYFPQQNQCPNLLPYAQTLNAHIAYDAALFGARVAPVFSYFGGATTPNPYLCSYTWICSSVHDIHPTTLGYSVIAKAFEAAAGY